MTNDRKKAKRKPPVAGKTVKAVKASEKPVYPRPFTEQLRERKPGTKTRDEIHRTTIRGKTH